MSDVRTVKIKFKDLVFLEDNPRTIKRESLERLAKRIQDDPAFFEARPCLVNFTDGKYICYGGFQRGHAAAKILKWKEVPCSVENDVATDVMRRRAILDNTHDGEWDSDILANQWGDFSMEELGDLGVPEWVFGGDDEGEIPNNALNSEAQEDDFDPPEIETVKTDICLGDLFEIGKHKLLCGDSTKAEDVGRLMAGEKADMVFTSPPYNAGNSKTGAYSGGSAKRTDFKEMYNSDFDNMSKAEYFDFIISALHNISINCEQDTPVLWNVMYNAKSRDDYGKIVFSDKNPFSVKETIIWDKGVGMNICSTGILSRSCELIFLMSIGEKYYTNQSNDVYWNVWRISNKSGENMSNGHGASFPVGLPFEGISKFSKIGAVVYEPFTGSGTTMVAAHQLNRKCCGMELSEKYCQIIIDRMLKLDPTLEIKKNGQPYKSPNVADLA